MGRFVIKLEDEKRPWYLVWSTVVDAPVTYGMSLEELKEFWLKEYGRVGAQELEEMLARVDTYGHSRNYPGMLAETIGFNRAGKDETCFSKEDLLAAYCYLAGSEFSWKGCKLTSDEDPMNFGNATQDWFEGKREWGEHGHYLRVIKMLGVFAAAAFEQGRVYALAKDNFDAHRELYENAVNEARIVRKLVLTALKKLFQKGLR